MAAPRIPRSSDDDYTPEAARQRRDFLTAQTGAALGHVGSYSFDPSVLPGNVEHFTGVAQVPIGVAGPLLVDGEHARGEFYVPLATTEGTLVASYNRGMKLLREAGGVKVTVTDDAMQRAPVFLFDDAREARDFGGGSTSTSTTSDGPPRRPPGSGRLRDIEPYTAGRFFYTRFNYTTGDAAGQNMTGKATYAACEWIRGSTPSCTTTCSRRNLATDKKHSHLNVLRSRGKRVIAEATIPDAAFREIMNVSSAAVYRARQISTLGGYLSGITNNGAHSANGITALFMATGRTWPTSPSRRPRWSTPSCARTTTTTTRSRSRR